jgi:hypothetical protein
VASEEGTVEMVSVNVLVIDNFLRNGALIRAAIQTEIVGQVRGIEVKKSGHDTYRSAGGLSSLTQNRFRFL